MIRFTRRNVGINSDAYIYYYISVEVSQDQQRFLLKPCVEDLNARDLDLAAVGKGVKKKTKKRNLDILGEINYCAALVTKRTGSRG